MIDAIINYWINFLLALKVMERHSQRCELQINPIDIEFGYPQPVPILSSKYTSYL